MISRLLAMLPALLAAPVTAQTVTLSEQPTTFDGAMFDNGVACGDKYPIATVGVAFAAP
jgi:hypothetical protein